MRKIFNFIREIKKSKFGISIVLLLIFIIGCINSFVGIVVFSNELLNLVSLLCILAIPLMLIINGFRFPNLGMKICNFLFFAILACLSILIAFLSLLSYRYSPFHEYNRTQEIEMKNYSFSIYKVNSLSFRNNGYGRTARQEKAILPGMLIK